MCIRNWNEQRQWNDHVGYPQLNRWAEEDQILCGGGILRFVRFWGSMVSGGFESHEF